MADDGVSFVSAAQAKEIDEKLMGPEFGFSIDQLMELAGLSVASALCEVYSPRSHSRVLVLCGPGEQRGRRLGRREAPVPLRVRSRGVLSEAHG